MTKPTQARAEARALLNAVLEWAAIGTTTAGALPSVYLMGGMAQEAVTHARIAKLADADEMIVAHQSPTVEGRLRSVTLLAEAMEPAAA